VFFYSLNIAYYNIIYDYIGSVGRALCMHPPEVKKFCFGEIKMFVWVCYNGFSMFRSSGVYDWRYWMSFISIA